MNLQIYSRRLELFELLKDGALDCFYFAGVHFILPVRTVNPGIDMPLHTHFSEFIFSCVVAIG